MSDLQLETTLTANAGPLNAALQGAARQVDGFSNTVAQSTRTTTAATKEATTAATAMSNAAGKFTADAPRLVDAAKKQAESITAVGVSAKQTAAAMRQLPAQFTDIATQLAGGQNPLLVLLQQGGQIKDSFGGVGNAIRAVASSISPLAAVVGITAGAAAVLITAFESGRSEAREYSKALILTGNAAGTTSSELGDMARAVSAVAGTQGKAAETLAALAGTGNVARTDLVKLGTTAVKMERELGISVQDTADKFSALAKDPLAASMKLNQGVNYLTASTYENIRALTAQGKTAEAAAVAQNAFADAMKNRTDAIQKNLGYLETAWRGVADGAKWAWDKMLGLGREDTLEQKLNNVAKKLADARKANERNKFAGLGIPDLEAEQAGLQEMQRLAKRGADVQAAQAAKNAKDLADTSTASQGAQAAIIKAGASARLAIQTADLETRRQLAEQAFARDETTAAEHQAALLEIDTARIQAQIQNIDKLKAAEAASKPKTAEETLQQRAALVQLDGQRVALNEKLNQLFQEEANGSRSVTPKSRTVGGADDLRRLKAADEKAVEEILQQRSEMSLAAQAQLVAVNKAGAVAMIKDDRERGLAQIALERQLLVERLNLAGLSATERRKVEEELAAWQLQREQQLTEQLKPEWQRRLEAWSDTNRLMKESYDTLMAGIVNEGENAFVNFMRTGKLNVRSLVDFMIAEFARMEYRKNLAPLVSKGASGLMGLLGLGGGGSANLGTSTGADLSTFFDLGPVAGGGATGSNELERDMITMVHKGEAIIPKQFNPWAGGGGVPGGQQMVQNITYNVPPGMSPAAFAGALEQNNRRLKAEMTSDMTRPGRPLQRAAARSGRF